MNTSLEINIGMELAKLVKDWRCITDKRLKPLKLTQTHWLTLHYISILPPEQSQIELARSIGIEQPSLVRTLDQLEAMELISRKICAHDRRAKRVRLTAKASQVIEDINQTVAEVRRVVLQGISEEELRRFDAVMHKMKKNIDGFYH